MNYYWILKLLILHLCTVLVQCDSYYSIIAPGLMKPNRKYTVAVTLHDAKAPCSIRVAISGKSFRASETVALQPFESKQIHFFPQKLIDGEYVLAAEGITGIEFKNESVLLVDYNAGPKIYIQTDKGVYKPQDSVQFRIVLLDEHTRPLNIREPIRVEILDHQDNRVKQFKDIALFKGVYSGAFQLAKQPVLGDWKISVTISGKYAFSKSKTIQVQKYVLPKFSVFLKHDKNFVLGDRQIKIQLYGKYTFNKYVEGNATVELWFLRTKMLQRLNVKIKTLALVEFDIKDMHDLDPLYSLMVKADLTEKHTGITKSVTSYIKIRNQRYNIIIPEDEIKFRNNKPYRLKAQVEYWSGAAVIDRKTPLLMVHGNSTYKSYLDENGIALFEFEHQSEADHVIRFKDSQQTLPNIFTNEQLSYSLKEFYCNLKIIGEKPRLGKTLQIEVSSSINIPYLVYTIVSHGSLIRMDHITLPSNTKSYIINLSPSIEMVPVSFIYVHYIQNGNLRYQEKKLEFPNEFENQISVTAPTQVKPGQNVTVMLNALPKSYVSILAVDMGVYLLDSSYDLDKKLILNDLLNERTYTPVDEDVVEYPGLLSGVLTLTNANYQVAMSYDHGYRGHLDKPNELVFRSKFPETWIFQNLEINETITELTLKIPDSITTWRITAFSNNQVTGFGIVNKPTDITTIQPFFINLNLPYSVKMGEIVKISVTIFNYLNQTVYTEITLYNNANEFHFMKSTKTGIKTSSDDLQQIKYRNLPSDDGQVVNFLIKPGKVGDIDLRITATNPLYSDAVHQKLKVEPDGLTKRDKTSIYLDTKENKNFGSSLRAEIPPNIIADSEHLSIVVGADYIVPLPEDLNDLVQMPTGCGEQNMVNFAPNILILQYLKATGKYYTQKQLVRKAKEYIDIGYQQQLSFRHRNGGFSVFGESSDDEASTWLTAYVVRFLIKASKYTPIETRIIDSGLDYLAKAQRSNGEFPYTGYLFNPAHKNKYGMTSFVLLTFLENHKNALKYQNTIQKGIELLNSAADNVEDIYSLSIMAIAMQMAKQEQVNRIIEKIKLQCKKNNNQMWWTDNDTNRGKDVEITAYVLMALLETSGEHKSILEWLVEQRNSNGGFKSTHDTVVALEALVKYSEKYHATNAIDMNITYLAKDLEENILDRGQFAVNSDNVFLLQKKELPQATRYLSYELNGTGYSALQLAYQYNVNKEEQVQHFRLEPKATMLNSYILNLEICFSYRCNNDQMEDEATTSTNMVIVEANLPSGFRSDAEFNAELLDNELIQRIEAKNEENTIVLYLDNLLANIEHCLNIEAQKITDVHKRKPAVIKICDYYNTSRTNTILYSIEA